MLRPSKKMFFAIEAVVDIAFHSGGAPVQSGEITRRQGIPRRYLEQTLQHLVRTGILAGMRGPRGGYRLARERRKITVGEIVRVVHALDQHEDVFTQLGSSDLAVKVLHPMWMGLREETMARLDAITIEDLCATARDGGLASDAAEAIDFSI